MSYKRILTIQDISCVGQCSLTAALPILSACGMETCIMPSAVLSTHSVGFDGYTFRDLTEDMPKIQAHWQKEGIVFDAIYTGYLGNIRQIEYIKQIFSTMGRPNCIRFVDPVMADGGKLYPGLDEAYVEAMKGLCSTADVILPNITEACLLTGAEYRETYDRAYVEKMAKSLSGLGPKTVIITGVGFTAEKTGVFVYEDSKADYYEHDRIETVCHGTGDVFASSFVGAAMKGVPTVEAAKLAADFTLQSVINTQGDEGHWYGVKFETALKELILRLP